MERPEIPLYTDHADAPICAFEHKPDLTELSDDARAVTIEAVAHAMDGRQLRLDPVEFTIGPAEPPFSDPDGAAAGLRRRSVRAVSANGAWGWGDIRALAFTHMLTYGGGSLYLFELLRRLVREPGFHCEVVSLADGPLRAEFEAVGIPVHVTDGFPVTSVARYEGHVAELLAWSATRGFNAALVNTLGSFVGGDLAGRLGIPAVWAVHESFTLPMFWFTAYAPGTLHPYARARAEQALRRASAVAFEAEATRELFLPHADAERLVTLPYGIELDAIDAARRSVGRRETRRRLGIEDDARVLLCLGSIEPRKSQTMLAAAFAQIAHRHPRARLVLVGETDDAYCADYRASLHEYVARAGLEERVRIEPVSDAPYDWHAVADVVVCASDIESLPRVIIEAMAFGTPVLSTRVYGIPELIEDGRTGYLCEMRDLADLARGLDRVLNTSGDELREVARAASDLVRARHDPAMYAEQMMRLLSGLVSDPNVLPGDALARRRVRRPRLTPSSPRRGASV
jgi:glycosyltransferase involved in cell wall biosynthesis